MIREGDITYDEIKEYITEEKLPVMCHEHGYQAWVLTDGSIGCAVCVRDSKGKEK